jgi:hypothetical protein
MSKEREGARGLQERRSGAWGLGVCRATGVGLLLLLGVVMLALLGCGGDDTALPETATTAAGSVLEQTVEGEGGFGYGRDESLAPSEGDKVAESQGPPTTNPGSGGLGVAEQSLDRKVISNAAILMEVSEGTFQTTFDRALQLADKYGGYVVSSTASAAEGEDVLRSGTITVRIPSQSFNQALSDAGELGEVKSRNIDSQDVTEEYVDLEARLVNARAQEKALRSLMDKAETIDEILQVQQYLAQIQMEIEQHTGRLRFLDEHTSYSTLTISVYESGADVPDNDDWGFVAALRDALHAFVDGVNAIIVGLGGVLPALIVLVVLAYVVYRIVVWSTRRRREQRQATPTAGLQPGPPQNAAQQVTGGPQPGGGQGYQYPTGYGSSVPPAAGTGPHPGADPTLPTDGETGSRD